MERPPPPPPAYFRHHKLHSSGSRKIKSTAFIMKNTFAHRNILQEVLLSCVMKTNLSNFLCWCTCLPGRFAWRNTNEHGLLLSCVCLSAANPFLDGWLLHQPGAVRRQGSAQYLYTGDGSFHWLIWTAQARQEKLRFMFSGVAWMRFQTSPAPPPHPPHFIQKTKPPMLPAQLSRVIGWLL